MSETLDFPTLVDPAPAPTTGMPAVVIEPKTTDLAKLDLTAVALAQYGDWRKDVDATKKNLSTLVLDLSTPAKIKEARALRQRLIGDPLATVRKVAAAIKSKMAQTSKAVGGELEAIETAYKEADALILPAIERREQQLAAEKAERDRIEAERRAGFEAKIAAIRACVARCDGIGSERIAKGIAQLKAMPTPTTEAWQEFAVPAADAICQTLDKMRAMHANALADEAEAVRREQERQEAERVRKENEELRARLAAAEAEKQRAELAARQAEQSNGAASTRRDVTNDAPAVEQTATTPAAAPPITQDAQERGSLPAAAGACASTGAEAATAPGSGDEGKGAHAEKRAPEPVFNIVSLERGAAAIDAASSGSPELNAALECIATMELYKITMIEPIMGIDPRDALLREALALTKYAAAPFFSKFPTHPKTTPEWWAGLREQIEALQPKLIKHIEGLN